MSGRVLNMYFNIPNFLVIGVLYLKIEVCKFKFFEYHKTETEIFLQKMDKYPIWIQKVEIIEKKVL